MVRTLRRSSLLLLSATLLFGVLAACSSAYPTASVPVVMTAAPNGGLASLTDATALEPACLTVDVTRVEAVPVDAEGDGADSGGPVLVADVGATYDLTDLPEIDSVTLGSIGLLGLPEDVTYGQVRFIAESGRVGFDDETSCDDGGAWSPVFLPSGPQTGLKVNLDPPVTVAELSGAHAVVLEFDVDRLIATSEVHPYLLSPTAVRAYVDFGDE